MTTQESTDSVTSNALKRNSKDVGWEYAVLIDENNLDKLKCLLCGRCFSGGIYRMKHHIARITGNVAACDKSSVNDQLKCRDAINKAKRKKAGKMQSEEELRSQVKIYSDDDIDASSEFKSQGPMDKFATQINPEESMKHSKTMRNQNIKDAICKEKLDRVKEYVCRFAYEANIHFSVFELDCCKKMFEAIGQYGVGCRPPTRYEMSEPFLKNEVERTKASLKPQEKEWKTNGCSIMTDAWSDRKRRSIMNLCVNSRLGTAFISSKDFSDTPHTGQVIHDYVEECIKEVGPENVVQIVTDNASNNMAAAKLLKQHRPQIFWTSCATHSINLMLESIANLPRFKKTIDQAKALTIFI